VLRDRQHAIVGQGLALGCAHLAWAGGVPVLAMESRFEVAWSGWPHRRLFPGIFVHYTSWDFTNCMMVPSEYRPGRRAFWTDRSGAWLPQLEEGWAPQEIAGLLASENQLPVTFDDWVDLATSFGYRGPRRGGWWAVRRMAARAIRSRG